MTLEQIVNTHPCPIIRGKIMENVANNNKTWKRLNYVLNDGFLWAFSKEGYDFWKSVYDDKTATYSDLKHLDLSYVPEPAQPPVMWRKIDKDNLPKYNVIAMKMGAGCYISALSGELTLDENGKVGVGELRTDPTHYIQLSDLINLPIED
jgi:hypothetical protein